jgi:hypothetical protein
MSSQGAAGGADILTPPVGHSAPTDPCGSAAGDHAGQPLGRQSTIEVGQGTVDEGPVVRLRRLDSARSSSATARCCSVGGKSELSTLPIKEAICWAVRMGHRMAS